MSIKRREFIKVIGATGATVLLPSVISGCAQRDLQALSPWNGPNKDMGDIRLKVISYGILAPNPHNIQPWIIKLESNGSFSLYVDQDRLLPKTDPYYRQVIIGHGTFLENVKIAARQSGYEPNINYFPKGQFSNREMLDQPIANVILRKSKDVEAAPLFKQILKRQSNKRSYEKVDIPLSHFKEMQESISENNLSFKFFTAKKDLVSFEQILTNAMELEVGDHARDLETIKMFRFNDRETEKFRDGFSIAQTGKSGLLKKFVETFFLNRISTEKDSTDFGKQAITLTHDQATSASAYCLIVSKNNERIDQVKTGEAYNRINLIATKLGLAMHPMSQVLQEYSDMDELQSKFLKRFNISKGETVQMLFRLGKASPVEHSARRRTSDIIRK